MAAVVADLDFQPRDLWDRVRRVLRAEWMFGDPDAHTRWLKLFHEQKKLKRAGEVFDYASSKPNIEAWSAEMAKASDGKSLGNIRGQHSNIAAGKLVELTFDDDLKKVGFVAKMVDDNE